METKIDYLKFLTSTEQAEFKFMTNKFVGNDFYLVGGSVRDMVLGLAPKDYDFATNVLPDQIKELFVNEPSVQLIEVGESFGVIKLMFLDSKNQYEIATYRTDCYNVTGTKEGFKNFLKSKYENEYKLFLKYLGE